MRWSRLLDGNTAFQLVGFGSSGFLAMRQVWAARYVPSTKPRPLPKLLGIKSRTRMGRDHSSTPRSKPTPAATAAFRGHNSNRGAQFLSSAALLGSGTAVLLDVGLHRLSGVVSSVNNVARRDVSMMCRGFVAPGLVMLGGFFVMRRRMLQVLCNMFVVSRSLLRHETFSG
jgi:hypothetical protein